MEIVIVRLRVFNWAHLYDGVDALEVVYIKREAKIGVTYPQMKNANDGLNNIPKPISEWYITSTGWLDCDTTEYEAYEILKKYMSRPVIFLQISLW